MNLENARSSRNASVYYSVEASPTELVLQPHCSRHRAMGAALLGLVGFEVLLLPLTILPALFVTIIILATLSATAPVLQNHWITHSIIFLLWAACLAAIAFLTGKAIWTSGYTTFIFERLQKQLAINTLNLLGRKFLRTIPFAQIRDVQLIESGHEGMSISISLILEKNKIFGLTHQEKVILSGFTSRQYKTVETLTARKHHQELLLLIRTALGFSTHEISAELHRSLPIPTEEELQQQKEQALLEAKDSLQAVAKMIFSSRQKKQEEIEALRQKTRAFPEDPKVWEQLAFLLATQKNVSRDEVVSAYRQAEILYRDRGDIEQATTIAQTLKRIG